MKRTSLKLLIATISTFILINGSIHASASEQKPNTDTEKRHMALTDYSKKTNDSNNEEATSKPSENVSTDKCTIIDSNSSNTQTTTPDKNQTKTEDSTTTENTDKTAPTDSNSSNTQTTTSDKNQTKTEDSTTTEKTDKTTPTDNNSSNTQTTTPDKNQAKTEDPTTTEKPVDSDYSGITDLGNTSLNNAAYVDLNTMTYGQIKVEGEQRWYLTKVDKGKKITAFLGYKAESAIDLNLYLFKYNESDGSITQVAYSALNDKSLSSNEQLSYISDGGYYFICVNSASGFDANNKYRLVLISSDKYDSAEADDSIFQRQILSDIPKTINQTIDNDFDVDWIQFTVPENKNISGTFQNSSSTGKYNMSLYDSNLNYIASLSQGQNFNGLFQAGVYFIKIESISGCDADTPYTITFTPYDNISTRKTASDFPTITDSIDNELDENWIEYSTTDSKNIQLRLTNPNPNTQYVLDICTATSDGNLSIFSTIKQGDFQNVTFTGGTYYLRVRSVNGYDPNTKYTLSLINYTADPNYLCSTDHYTVTTNSSRNELYINGTIVSLDYVTSSSYYPGGDTSSHVTTQGNSKITNYGIVNYNGKTCVCIEVANAVVYTWRYADHSSHMEYLPVALGQFVIDLRTGTCIDAGALNWV